MLKNRDEIKQRLYLLGGISAGLLCSQIIATLHVYISNMTLFRSTISLTEAGYLAIPNARTAEDLTSVLTALKGAIFFTLSLGAGLSMLSVCSAWAWDRIFRRDPKVLGAIILIWMLLLILINLSHINIPASAYITIVCPITWMATLILLPSRSFSGPLRLSFMPVAVFVFLTVSWSSILDRNLFINIRDYLLLSNPIGQRVNDFYYDYTLFPAEAIKSLDQKQIRTCRIGQVSDQSIALRLEKALRFNDYLNVPQADMVNLYFKIENSGYAYLMEDKGEAVLRMTLDDFFEDPAQALRLFSKKMDSGGLFRRLVFYSLLVGFPLILYSVVYSLFYLVISLLFNRAIATTVSSVSCLGIGILMLVQVNLGSSKFTQDEIVPRSFQEDSPSVRISVIRRIYEEKKEIAEIDGFEGLIHSPHLAERYWLARCLAYSRHQSAQKTLYELLEDRSPNVVCQAFWALGKRGERGGINKIINKIKTSTHWYEQYYGYRALRSLGWMQPRSKLHSF